MQDSDALVLEILKQDETLKMSVFEKQELALTVRHYSQCQVSFKEINYLCREIISILNKANKKENKEPDLINSLKKAGQLLWDQLLTRAVKDRLKNTQILDLLLSIDEELINIPWELLYDADNFLCLKFNLGRLVRTKEQVSPARYRSYTGVLKMLILANPTADLKSAYLEGINIKNQLERKTDAMKIDFKSTRIDTLYIKKNLRDYDIVHFAGHCEYDSDNPQKSGWVFSDEKLTAQDIIVMSQTLNFPALIFSNACHSARTGFDLIDLEYQEKNYGLASAFLFSGVRHYIGAIRKIEDSAGLTFAKEFYAQLIAGRSVGECLRLARLSLIKDRGFQSLSWTGYLLYGDPNFVLFKAKPKASSLKFERYITWERLKKPLTITASVICIIFVIIYLYMWLPTINPNTYILFLNSRKAHLSGRNEEALRLCNSLLKKDPLFLATYPLLADTYHRYGDKDSVLKYYFDYALYSEKRNDKKHLASAYISIGWTYHLQGEYQRAWDFYQKAINLSRGSRDRLNEAIALRKLAVWYMDREDYEHVLELLTKSSEINRERQHIYEYRYNLACDYFDLGLLFTNKDDFTTAKEFYQKSQQLFERLKVKNESSDYYFNLGEIYLFEKQYQKALDYYLKGLKIDQKQDNKPNLAGDYNMLGELYLEMDNPDEAERFFHQALTTCSQINAPPELASVYRNLGLLYKKKGSKNKARDYLRLAQEIYSRIDTAEYENLKKELLDLGQ
jgi:CHAT domain-containing protein/Tfp pilus assembly protein PilF